MCGILTPSDEEFTSNYKVHRIVFENILVDRENLPEGNDRSLSIPFDGKMRPVWAPNGYGKTFAFKILSFRTAKESRIQQLKTYKYGPTHVPKNREKTLSYFHRNMFPHQSHTVELIKKNPNLYLQKSL